MHTYLLEMLECPACHGELAWDIGEENEDRIEAAEARCTSCAAIYPVREGIGLFLTPDLPRNDLWEQIDSGLMQHLREHPELEDKLMEPPMEELAPADRFFRALLSEERGDCAAAKATEESANRDMYTPEYSRCWDSQVEYIIERLSSGGGPVVDLASGRCYLVEQMLRSLARPVVATDFSPGMLRRSRRKLNDYGLGERVSFLAFDARRTPFKDEAVDTLTTNLGLPNIEEPGNLLQELRRIVTGVFLAVSHFYPEEEDANAEVIREVGMETMLYRRKALQQFSEAGWHVEVKNECMGEARPTPAGVILEDARIDGLPVNDTLLEWCVLMATGKIFDSE